MIKTYHANTNQKKVAVVILLSTKQTLEQGKLSEKGDRIELQGYDTWRLQDPFINKDRANSQKISKDIGELNSTMNQLDIIDIY